MELFPSRLSDTPGGLAAALRTSFEVVGHLEHAVVFIDEVEEIASRRGGIPPSPTQGVTNELLKLVADFRDHSGRLLICATNFVRALDAAFLRHGRFDYVIPIGLPDPEARAAIWQRYIPASVVPSRSTSAPSSLPATASRPLTSSTPPARPRRRLSPGLSGQATSPPPGRS